MTSGEYTNSPEDADRILATRDKNHHKNSDDFDKANLDKESLDKDAIRGREQMLIEHFGGAKSEEGTSGNAINGISPQNQRKDHYLQAAIKAFGFLLLIVALIYIYF